MSDCDEHADLPIALDWYRQLAQWVATISGGAIAGSVLLRNAILQADFLFRGAVFVTVLCYGLAIWFAVLMGGWIARYAELWNASLAPAEDGEEEGEEPEGGGEEGDNRDDTGDDGKSTAEKRQHAKQKYGNWYGCMWRSAAVAGALTFFLLGWMFVTGQRPGRQITESRDEIPSSIQVNIERVSVEWGACRPDP